MDCPLTQRTRIFSKKAWIVLDVLVVLFRTASSSGLFFALGYEAVAASAGEVAFREVELEASTHLGLDVVDFGVSEKVGALRVSYDIDSVPMLDNVCCPCLVQL